MGAAVARAQTIRDAMPTTNSELPANPMATPILDQTTTAELQANDASTDAPQDGTPAGQGGPEGSLGANAAESLPVFRAPDGRLCSILNGRSYAIDSREFREAVRYTVLNSGDVPPAEAEVRDFLGRLKIRGHAAAVHDVFIRVAATPHALYLDLASARGEVVEVTAEGWKLTTEPPVRFARPPGTLPIAAPSRDGDYQKLRRFVRLSEPAFHLLVASLVYQLRPVGPQPITVLLGEQGSAKSTLTKQLRRLVDPRSPEVRRPPGSTRDFMIAATRSWILAYDNLSELKPWFSDALCTVATGGGFGARTSHTDGDETTFDARRPVILNGIDDFVRRDDLRDRCIVYELEPIPATERRDESSIWREFTDTAPAILGGLLDLCSGALRELPNVATHRLPRMADFFQWALAVERAGGWLPGTIERAYADQRRATDVDAMEDPLVQAIEEFISKQEAWSGTPSALLEVLEASVPRTARGASWPRSPSRFGGELRRLMDLLRRNGALVELVRSGARRTVRLARAPHDSPALPSLASPLSSKAGIPTTETSDGSDGSDGSVDQSMSTLPAAERVPAGPTAPGSTANGLSAIRGGDEIASSAASPLAISEEALVGIPRRLHRMVKVLRGRELSAKEVVEALRNRGELPKGRDPHAYVSQELSHGTRDGVFRRVRLGIYTC